MEERNFNIFNEWIETWKLNVLPEWEAMLNRTSKPSGFDMKRKEWCTLNRIRTGHGRCADFKYKCGFIPSAVCDCGAERQTIKHIIEDCPLRKYPGVKEDFAHLPPKCISWISQLDLSL